MSTAETEIRRQIARYLVGEVHLRDLDQIVTAIAWDTDADRNAIDLANAILLSIGEYADGVRTEDGVRDVLRPLVTAYETVFTIAMPAAIAGTAVRSSASWHYGSRQSVNPPRFAGKQLEVGS